MPLVPPKPCLQYKEIIEHYDNLLHEQQRRSGRGAAVPEMAKCYSDLGEAYFQCDLFLDALKYLKEALQRYIQYHGENSKYVPEIGHTHKLIGNTFVEMERFGQAIQHFHNAESVFKAAYGSTAAHDSIAEVYYCTGEALRRQCRLEEAREYNVNAVTMLIEIHGEDDMHELLAKAHFFLGYTLKDQCHYEQADRQFLKANRKFRHIYADFFISNPGSMTILNVSKLFIARGEVQEEMGNFGQARYRYNHANIACKTFWGDDEETSHVYYAEIFDKVGGLNLRKQSTDIAMIDFGQAYALRSEFFDDEPNHAALAKSYILFGHSHKTRFEYEKAINYYDHAADIYDAIYREHNPPNHPNIARCQNYIGETLLQTALYQKAIDKHSDALFLLKEFFGTSANHPDIAWTYSCMAAVYLASSNYDKAHEFNHKALTMYKELHYGNSDHLSIANCYYDYGRTYLAQGELHQASEYFSKAIAMIDCIFATKVNLQILVDLRCNIGHVQFKQHQYENAISSYVKALEMAEKLYENIPSHPSLASCNKFIGDVYTDTGDIDDAKSLYRSVIRIYEEFHTKENMTHEGNRHPGMVETMIAMSKCHAIDDEHESARDRLKEAEAILRLTHGTYPNPIRGDLYKLLGDAYERLGETKMSLEHYCESLMIREKVYGANCQHRDIAESSYLVGVQLGKLSQIQDSLKHHQRALDIRECIYQGIKHYELADSYTGLATAYMQMGSNDQALEYYTKALNMKIDIYKPNDLRSVEVAESCTALGNFFVRIENYDQALEYHHNAQQIYEEIGNEENICFTLDDIGMVHLHRGMWDEAISSHQLALAQKESNMTRALEGVPGYSSKGKSKAGALSAGEKKVYHRFLPEIAISHEYIGNVYFADAKSAHHGEPASERRYEKYEQAYRSYVRALEEFEKVYGGKPHQDIADAKSNIGLVLQSEAMQMQGFSEFGHGDNWETALKFHNEALEIRKKLFGEHEANVDIAFSYHQIGKCYHHRGDFTEAVQYYERALKDFKSIFGEHSHNTYIGQVYSSLGATYYEAGMFDQALESYQKSHRIIHPAHHIVEQNVVEVAASYKNLGNVYESLGKKREARSAKETARKIIEDRIGAQEDDAAQQSRCSVM